MVIMNLLCQSCFNLLKIITPLLPFSGPMDQTPEPYGILGKRFAPEFKIYSLQIKCQLLSR